MKLYIFIDCQNDFCSEYGSLVTEEAKITVPKVVEVAKVIQPEDYTILTFDTHYERNYLETLEGKNLPIYHCIYDTWGWDINQDIAVSIPINYMDINKNTFGSEDLIQKVKDYLYYYECPIDEIIVCGFVTDICVISNVLMLRAAVDDVPITVIANACAGTTAEKHRAAIEVMRSCQINIKNI